MERGEVNNDGCMLPQPAPRRNRSWFLEINGNCRVSAEGAGGLPRPKILSAENFCCSSWRHTAGNVDGHVEQARMSIAAAGDVADGVVDGDDGYCPALGICPFADGSGKDRGCVPGALQASSLILQPAPAAAIVYAGPAAYSRRGVLVRAVGAGGWRRRSSTWVVLLLLLLGADGRLDLGGAHRPERWKRNGRWARESCSREWLVTWMGGWGMVSSSMVWLARWLPIT